MTQVDEGLLPCPFCRGAMMFRKALNPSDGNVDAIIHAFPTGCPMGDFLDGTIDESIIGRWNTRAPPPDSGGVNALRLVQDNLAFLQHDCEVWAASEAISQSERRAVKSVVQRIANIRNKLSAALSRPSHYTERREELALPPVKRIEMVKGFFPEEPADPMWRVEVSGIVTDFDTETAANNFRNAILALTEQNSGPTAGREIANVRWAVNILLEKIAEKFEGWDTYDLMRSDAAATVRSFKHDLALTPSPSAEPVPRCEIVGDHEIVTRHCIPYCPPKPSECG